MTNPCYIKLNAGLEIAILTEALQRSRKSNHTEVGAWLLQEFQTSKNNS